jgi:hypothetical protein
MAKIRFHGKEIQLDTLLKVLKGAPEITVKASDLHQGSASQVDHIPRPLDLPDTPVSLYKFDNKYLVLTGSSKIKPEHTYVVGRLVTKHMVNRCQAIDAPAPVSPPPAPPAAEYDDRPRFQREPQRPRLTNPVISQDPRAETTAPQGQGAVDRRPRFNGTGNNAHSRPSQFQGRPPAGSNSASHNGRPNSFPRGPRRTPETQS